MIVFIRQSLFLSLDELLEVTRLLINQNVSRAVLSRCLKKHGVPRLQKPKAEMSGAAMVDCIRLPRALSNNQQWLIILVEQFSSHVSFALVDKMDVSSKERLADFLVHSLPYKIHRMTIPDYPLLKAVADHLSVDVELKDEAVSVSGEADFDRSLAELLCGELFDQRLVLGATLLEYEDTLNKSVIRNRLNKLTPSGYHKLHR